MGGMFVSLLANLVSMVANVVVHITANDKMHYICYRHFPPTRVCPKGAALASPPTALGRG
jgi:hypothetical protein